MKKALLEFFLRKHELICFIVRPKIPALAIDDDEPIVLRLKVTEEQVHQVNQEIRNNFKELIEKDKEVEDYSLSSFYDLGYQIFTVELMEHLKRFEALYLVPFGPLHYLPLHAMKFQDQYLIDLFKISYLPSASVLQYMQPSTDRLGNGKILLGGVDSTGEENHFAKETDQIAALPFWLDEDIVYLRKEDCTPKNIIANCGKAKLVHLSSHGHFATENPLLSGALLFGQYSPSYLDEQTLQALDYQNILTVKNIFEQIQMQVDLFVMSGCVTGDSAYNTGDELVGLTRALMYAGAKSMIVSLYPTFKNLTSQGAKPKLQFAEFYRLLFEEKLSKAGAFQAYVKGFKKDPESRHPYNWMSFIFVGNLE